MNWNHLWQALKDDRKLRVLAASRKSVKRGRAIQRQLLRRGKLEVLKDVTQERTLTRINWDVVGDRRGGMQRPQVGGQGRVGDGTQDARPASDVHQPWSWTLNMVYCGCLHCVSEVHHLRRNSYIRLLWGKNWCCIFLNTYFDWCLPL